jgi:hypothetical protein
MTCARRAAQAAPSEAHARTVPVEAAGGTGSRAAREPATEPRAPPATSHAPAEPVCPAAARDSLAVPVIRAPPAAHLVAGAHACPVAAQAKRAALGDSAMLPGPSAAVRAEAVTLAWRVAPTVSRVARVAPACATAQDPNAWVACAGPVGPPGKTAVPLGPRARGPTPCAWRTEVVAAPELVRRAEAAEYPAAKATRVRAVVAVWRPQAVATPPALLRERPAGAASLAPVRPARAAVADPPEAPAARATAVPRPIPPASGAPAAVSPAEGVARRAAQVVPRPRPATVA